MLKTAKPRRTAGTGSPGEYDRTEIDATGLEAPFDPNNHPLDATISPKFEPPRPRHTEQPKQEEDLVSGEISPARREDDANSDA